MSTLTPKQARILGVLIEKARTVPGSYPMSINSVQNGANQKSNRSPIMKLTEDDVQIILDELREKGFVAEAHLTGSRVVKYRHLVGEKLSLQTSQQSVLAELLLRGPQTIGEIRSRAGRMYPLESIEVARNVIDSLMQLDPPLAKRYPPPPGSRAENFGQLLCVEAHPVSIHTGTAVAPSASVTNSDSSEQSTEIRELKSELSIVNDRVNTLESRLGILEAQIKQLASNLGEPLE